MQTIRHELDGDVRFIQCGMVVGSAIVAQGVTLMLRGTITQDLILDAGSYCELDGTVTGTVRNHGGELVVRGMVLGSVLTSSGSTNIASGAVVKKGIHRVMAAQSPEHR